MLPAFLSAEREIPRPRVLSRAALLLALFFTFLPSEILAVTLTVANGKIYLLKSGTSGWSPATQGMVLSPGDRLRTESSSRAQVTFEDGTKIEIGPNGSFTLQDTGSKGSTLQLSIGFLRAWVAKRVDQQFKVRTPTAVCSVRGTEFSVDVTPQGDTKVEMFSGVLGVADQKGNEVVVTEGQTIGVTAQGLGQVQGAGAAQEGQGPEAKREGLRREVGLGQSKEDVQAAAAAEQKNAVYQQGKAIIDVNGNRVRIEEYVVRPEPDKFKFVVLNERLDRFDYFYYQGTFNTTIPDDLSIALRQLPGCVNNPCPFFLKEFETARSNTIDNMFESAKGGHQVDVNNNLVSENKVDSAYDAATDTFLSLNIPNPGGIGNQSFFKTLFNTNKLSFNGVEHFSYSPGAGAPVVADCGGAAGACVQNTRASTLAGGHLALVETTKEVKPPFCGPPNCSLFEPGIMHDTKYTESADGKIWDKIDSYIISNEGKIAQQTVFSGLTSGTQYKAELLNWNFQTIVTASEFNGRKIDLAVEPKIFIQMGIIP